MLMRTVGVAERELKSPIRVRRAPRTDPPFDDELAPEADPLADQLAFDWSEPDGRSKETHHPEMAGSLIETIPMAGWSPAGHDRREVASATGPTQRAGPSGAQPHASPPTHAMGATQAGTPHPGASGDARLAVRRFVTLLVEVLNGYRPAAHLRHLSLPRVAPKVVAQGLVGASRAADLRRDNRRSDRRRRRPVPVAVLRLRLFEPRPGAVEATVVLVTGERTWAAALRLELHEDSWCATVLRLI